MLYFIKHWGKSVFTTIFPDFMNNLYTCSHIDDTIKFGSLRYLGKKNLYFWQFETVGKNVNYKAEAKTLKGQ